MVGDDKQEEAASARVLEVVVEKRYPEWIERGLKILDGPDKPPEERVLEEWGKLIERAYEFWKKADLSALPVWHRRWIEWTLEVIEKLCASKKWEDGEPEKWEKVLDEKLGFLFTPALTSMSVYWSAEVRFGAGVGHILELAQRTKDQTMLDFAFPSGRQVIPGVQNVLDVLREFGSSFCRVNAEQRIRRVKRVLALACEQPLEISRKFFRGVSLGMDKRVYTEQGEMVGDLGRGRIYQVMWIFSDLIKRFETMTELYEWLCFLLGRQVVGRDMDRLKKVCADLELSFRGPGRPRLENREP